MSKTAQRKSKNKIAWRGYQSGNPRRNVRLALLVLLGLFLLIIVGKMVSTLSFLNKPLSPDFKTDLRGDYSWDGQSNFNLIFKSDTVQVLSADPINNKLTIVKLPQDTYVNVAMGFGNWPIGSVYNLGQSEINPEGMLILQRTLESIFAIPVDGYIIIQDQTSSLSAEKFVTQLHDSLIADLNYPGRIKTNLTGIEYLKLVLWIKGVRADKIHTVDLGQSQITKSVLLPDGSRALGIDQPKLDQYIQGQFGDLRIGQEAVTVGFFNSTDHLGLAEMASRLVTNLGGRVIFTSNSQTHLDKTVVLGNSSYTKLRLEQIFSPQCLNDEHLCLGSSQKNEYSRADVTVYLGEDYFLRFNH